MFLPSNQRFKGPSLKLLLAIILLLGLVPLSLFASGGSQSTEAEDGGIFSSFSSLGQRLGLGGADDEPFLQPEKAFILGVEIASPYALTAYWDIADGYYLYRNKFSFSLEDPKNGVELGTISFPPGKQKEDESFGLMEVYFKQVSADIALIRNNKETTNIVLVVKYQGCAEAGFCYPPAIQKINLSLPAATTPPPSADNAANSNYVSEQDSYAQSLAQGSVWLSMLTFFGLGLLLAFTPCVFPMIPILASIIAGQGDKITTRRAFSLSLIYVLAMAFTYTAAGIMAGLWGSNLQAAFQNPWILISFSIVFIALAFSMFGFYELQMPSKIQSKLNSLSNKQQGGSYIGVAIMGLLSALIIGPCVAAPLAGALIYIGQTGDPILGGAALFALSLGMGAPLLVVGASAGKLLPKAGGWMNSVKAVFGVLLLAVAIWLLERITPGPLVLLMWAALFIISATYLGALEKLKPEASGWSKLWKGCGVILLIYGATLLVGAASGGQNMFQPLNHMQTVQANNSDGTPYTTHTAFKQIKGIAGFEQALADAKRENRPVMLDFYADWCISCKEMEMQTFSDPGVKQMLSKVILLQADVTANDATDKALLKHFGLIGPPSILLFTPAGEELRQFRVVGFLNAEKFATHLRVALDL